MSAFGFFSLKKVHEVVVVTQGSPTQSRSWQEFGIRSKDRSQLSVADTLTDDKVVRVFQLAGQQVNVVGFEVLSWNWEI